MKQEIPDGWTDFRLVSNPLRYLANLTGCPLLSDSVDLSASNWGFQSVLQRGARRDTFGDRLDESVQGRERTRAGLADLPN